MKNDKNFHKTIEWQLRVLQMKKKGETWTKLVLIDDKMIICNVATLRKTI